MNSEALEEPERLLYKHTQIHRAFQVPSNSFASYSLQALRLKLRNALCWV